ncbi:hypothetical protein Lser_V15G32017 [Lactuca serriola]
MSPQIETKASVGFKAGLKDYKLTYYTPEYETKDTDILAAFRVTPQLGVPPKEAGAAVAAESSTGSGFSDPERLSARDDKIHNIVTAEVAAKIKEAIQEMLGFVKTMLIKNFDEHYVGVTEEELLGIMDRTIDILIAKLKERTIALQPEIGTAEMTIGGDLDKRTRLGKRMRDLSAMDLEIEAAKWGTGSKGGYDIYEKCEEPIDLLVTSSNAISVEIEGMSFATARRIGCVPTVTCQGI